MPSGKQKLFSGMGVPNIRPAHPVHDVLCNHYSLLLDHFAKNVKLLVFYLYKEDNIHGKEQSFDHKIKDINIIIVKSILDYY